MAFVINAKTLNERLEFCGRTREQLAEAIRARGQNCEVGTLKECCCRDNRPFLTVVNRMADGITAAWVRERREELAAEIAAECGESGVDVLYVDRPSVPVLRNGALIGVYDPGTRRLYH